MAKKLTTHERALAAIKVDADHPKLGWVNQYRANFDKWGVERLGSWPTPAMWAVATVTCKKSPGVEAVNVAMAQRPEGVQVPQYEALSGAMGAAHNHLGTLVSKNGITNIFDEIPRGTKVKCATITEKGMAEIDRLLISHGFKAVPKVKAVKPVKVQRKANAKPAPVTDTVVGTLTVRPTGGDDTITVDVLKGSDGSIAVDTHGDTAVTVEQA